jgi:hypothetical protein
LAENYFVKELIPLKGVLKRVQFIWAGIYFLLYIYKPYIIFVSKSQVVFQVSSLRNLIALIIYIG